jgi:hypothetical protein
MENSFEVTSGTLVCSDPCYSLDVWCMGFVSNVKKGKWNAYVEWIDLGGWGERIAMLVVHHQDNKSIKIDFNNPLNFDAGVDSGQFGFFDKDFYRNDESAKGLAKYDFNGDFGLKEEGDEWYRVCCALTLSEDSWGVLPNGAVSSSGIGDGSYDVFQQVNDEGEVIALCCVYLSEDDIEEEDEWLEEEE